MKEKWEKKNLGLCEDKMYFFGGKKSHMCLTTVYLEK